MFCNCSSVMIWSSSVKGNHEDMFLAYLGLPGQHGDMFLYNGGYATLISYGVNSNNRL